MKTTYFYYESGDRFTVYNSHTKKIETVNRLPYGKDSHIFYVFED